MDSLAPGVQDVAAQNGHSSPPDAEGKIQYLPLFEAPATLGRGGAEPRRRDSEEEKRRILNVFVGAVALLLALPLMIVIALAVKLTSRGPVFYTQHRVGLDRRRPVGTAAQNGLRRQDRGGKLFKIYKFRTMTASPRGTGEVWAKPGDHRVTPVGYVLRRYRLDELPQLWNVLRGDMNIVGPRPEQPEIFHQLRSKVERYVERQRVLPGITGWAQVNQSYDQCLDDVRRKVVLDLEYIRSRSTVEDLKIMARTLPVMIGKKGSV
jgi:lipopolysaccharide/colanic/teichoic acid biosynthesis glycosyltransferase